MAEIRNQDTALHATAAADGRNGSAASEFARGTGSLEFGSASPGLPRWKRVFDTTCILLTLPVWLPIILFVMVWVAISSRGSIFFRQNRIGYRGRPFMIFKFRTMYVNADTQTHTEHFYRLMEEDCPMTKLDSAGDPRLIVGGRFLRASGLDELPQIFNVLRGEMSLVGPRPCLPHEFDRYGAWQKERVNAPPGLTGFWQVNGKNKTTFSEMIAMDIFYSRNMNLWLDVKIIAKTIPALTEQTRESRGVPEIRSRPTELRTATVPEGTSGTASRI